MTYNKSSEDPIDTQQHLVTQQPIVSQYRPSCTKCPSEIYLQERFINAEAETIKEKRELRKTHPAIVWLHNELCQSDGCKSTEQSCQIRNRFQLIGLLLHVSPVPFNKSAHKQ